MRRRYFSPAGTGNGAAAPRDEGLDIGGMAQTSDGMHNSASISHRDENKPRDGNKPRPLFRFASEGISNMNDRRIILQSLEEGAERCLHFMAFPKKKRVGPLATMPFQPAQSGIYWSWYEWQIRHNFIEISDRLEAVTELVATEGGAKEASRLGMRGYHEWFVMQCAIVSGSKPAMALACKHVAGSAGRSDQYYSSLAGMLKARIEGDQRGAERQLNFSLKYKEDGVHPTPSRALQKAFVERDYATLDREVTKGAKRYWKDSFLSKAIVKDEPGELVIDPLQRHSHYQWAYPEAAIAKLAILDGATITHNDIWFPLEFIKGFTVSSLKE